MRVRGEKRVEKERDLKAGKFLVRYLRQDDAAVVIFSLFPIGPISQLKYRAKIDSKPFPQKQRKCGI